jgi:hypothetical protein
VVLVVLEAVEALMELVDLRQAVEVLAVPVTEHRPLLETEIMLGVAGVALAPTQVLMLLRWQTQVVLVGTVSQAL